ncbi:T9SS type A sorting domain-containing protein, partial [bacterium]|nr:T9SS type A sorting domain-containing protein [bacterium]
PEEIIFDSPCSWTFVDAEFSAGNNSWLTINAGINGGTSMAWFDDIAVERISVPGNLIGNGGFNDFTFPVWWDGEGPEWCHFHGNLHMPTMATEEYKEWFNMLEDGGTTVYGWEDRMSTGFHCYHHTPNELHMLGGDNTHEFNFYNPEFDSATFGMINRDLEASGLSSLSMRTARFAGFKHHLPTVIEVIKSGTVFLDRGWTTSGTCLLGTIIRPEGVLWESNTNWWLDYSSWSGTTVAISNLERGEFVLTGGHPGFTFSLDHPEHFDVVDGAFTQIESTFPNLTYLFPHDYAYMCEESRNWWGVQYEDTDDTYQLSFFGSAQNGQTIVQVLADTQSVGLPPMVNGSPADYVLRGNRIMTLLPDLDLGFHTVSINKYGTYVSPAPVPLSIHLKPPYPNPCNSWVTFPLELSHPATVELTIMDVLGRQVYRDRFSFESGARKVSLDIVELTSGTYFYRIKVDKEIQVGKLTILK